MQLPSKKLTTRDLNSLPPIELANLIESQDTDLQTRTFKKLNPSLAADTFDALSVRTQKKIIHTLPSKLIAKMLKSMPPDDLTALLEQLPKERNEEYLNLLPKEERQAALSLLSYPEDSVGHFMTTDYIAVKMDWTVEMVLDHIRKYGHDSETINLIYVVDDLHVLIDDINIREFLFVPKNCKVSQISDRKFLSLNVFDKIDKTIGIFKQNDRVALPVIDGAGVLRGIVTIDDILRLASKINTQNIQKVGGTVALDAPYMQTPFFDLIGKRSRWLMLLFIGEMFTASAMGYYENEIAKAVVLALFLPLIISSGGNAGSQSTTLIIRAMALGEVKLINWLTIFKKELLSGLVLGTILGAIGFARVVIWGTVSNIYGEHWLLIAITIFLSLIGVVLWGSLMGAMLPLILRKLNFDPATASAPLVATLVDVTGIVIYFQIASIIMRSLLI